MTVHFASWALPLALMIAIWAAAILWPLSPPTGGYDFGRSFEAVFHFTIALVLTLIFWLVYFATLVALR